MDELHPVEPVHLAMVVSFVLFLGPDPFLITQLLWLVLAVAFYLKYQGHDLMAQEGIGGKA